MVELDHWHPVLFSSELSRGPRKVRRAGHDLAVFRTAQGELGAMSDRCPHRGMSLSLGKVEQDRLVCPYHGWGWGRDGSAVVPATPSARPCLRAEDRFDAVERHGAIWVKRAGSSAAFPDIEFDGYSLAGALRHRADVPFELMLDNASEVEHSPYVHKFIFGYSRLNRMSEIRPRVTLRDDAVEVVNVGPMRAIPRIASGLMGVPERLMFAVEWKTRFSPVHTLFHHHFIDASTGEPVGHASRSAMFFNPIDAGSSEIFTFVFSTLRSSGLFGFGRLALLALRAYVNRELNLDMRALGKLADKQASLEGRILGRFDKAVLAGRSRVDRIYRGRVAHSHATLPNVDELQPLGAPDAHTERQALR